VEKLRVGEVFHYFPKAGVAAIRVTDTLVTVGDTLLFQGPSTNFDQIVDSLEIDKVKVEQATPGQSVGVKVRDRARPGDYVYKIVA